MLNAEKLDDFNLSWRPTPEKVDRAVKAAIEVAHPSRVFVFGSWARGEATTSSDLGLAVLPSSVGRSPKNTNKYA
jgi:predicted nucleotidyltransferase